MSEDQKLKIKAMSPIALFELFFSDQLKQYIIDSIFENGYELSSEILDTFVGILITTSFNSRKSDREYWSKESIVYHSLIASAMSRDKYLEIKRFLKFSKIADQNLQDRAW